MEITFQNIQDPGESPLLIQARDLNEKVFGTIGHYFTQRLDGKEHCLLTAATDGERLLGYKLGYPESKERFYSWIGAVHPDFRKQGIASTLMEWQHTWCKEHGYTSIRTKTKNQWKNMLILNLKHGFEVIGTYTDNKGEPKIMLEKKLR